MAERASGGRRNAYDVLGIRGAVCDLKRRQTDENRAQIDDEIDQLVKRAHRRLALARHVDKGGTTEAISELNTSRDLIANAEKRADYHLKDASNHPCSVVRSNTANFGQPSGGGGGAQKRTRPDEVGAGDTSRAQRQPRTSASATATEVQLDKAAREKFAAIQAEFEQQTRWMEEEFARKIEQFTRGTAPTASGGGGGGGDDDANDINVETSLSLEQLYEGVTKRFTVRRRTRIAGGAEVVRDATLAVNIPPGTYDGTRIVLRGAGQQTLQRPRAGDFIVTVREQPHDYFVRSGDDLVWRVSISLVAALLGPVINVPTFDGDDLRVTLKDQGVITAGFEHTVNGRGMRVPWHRRGEDIVYATAEEAERMPAQATGRGNLIIIIDDVIYPRSLTPQQRDYVRMMAGGYT